MYLDLFHEYVLGEADDDVPLVLAGSDGIPVLVAGKEIGCSLERGGLFEDLSSGEFAGVVDELYLTRYVGSYVTAGGCWHRLP